MASVFISGPFFSTEQCNEVSKIEQALKANPTVGSLYSPRLHQEGGGYKEFSHKWCQITYHEDLKHMLDADVDVVILDFDHNDPDSGTMFEFGYGKAHHKFMATILLKKYSQNLMIGVGSDYHFSNLKDLKTYDFNHPKHSRFPGKLH